MSKRKCDRRRIGRCYNVDANYRRGHLTLTFSGDAEEGRYREFDITIPLDFVPYLARDLKIAVGAAQREVTAAMKALTTEAGQ